MTRTPKTNAWQTHHPRFVEEVVDGLQGIDSRKSTVMKSKDYVLPVVTGISRVLTHQYEVRLKRTEQGRLLESASYNAKKQISTVE